MVSVTLDGTNIDHLVLDEDITIRVGRMDVLEQGQPGSASLMLYLSEWVDVGYKSLIVVTDGEAVRFSGRVTDVPRITWEVHPDDPDRWMCLVRVQCVGPLAGWGRQRVGDVPWPAETVHDRAQRIAGLTGQTLVVQGGAPTVVARDVDAQPAINLLEELATDCSGFLFDHAGTTYLQSLEVRRLTDPQERWDDQYTSWDNWVGTWDEQTENLAASPLLVLPPDAVLFAPAPEQTSRIANRVRVRYGPTDELGNQFEVTAEDPASIAVYGPEDVDIRTRLELAGDAGLRASLTLERAAVPQWYLPRVEVMWEALDDPARAAFDVMLPGQMVEVSQLPQPGPFSAFQGCVEGWTDQWSWDDAAEVVLRTTTLHLSDVRWSFAVLTWDGIVPDDLTWDAIDCTWDQMITADDLEDAA
jgi:hypothetical protein